MIADQAALVPTPPPPAVLAENGLARPQTARAPSSPRSSAASSRPLSAPGAGTSRRLKRPGTGRDGPPRLWRQPTSARLRLHGQVQRQEERSVASFPPTYLCWCFYKLYSFPLIYWALPWALLRTEPHCPQHAPLCPSTEPAAAVCVCVWGGGGGGGVCCCACSFLTPAVHGATGVRRSSSITAASAKRLTITS